MAKRLDVFILALVGIFGLTRAFESADTVKVYGCTDSVLSFLCGMHDAFGGLGALGPLRGLRWQLKAGGLCSAQPVLILRRVSWSLQSYASIRFMRRFLPIEMR